MNEEQLKKVVAEAVNRIINESYPTPSRREIAKSDLFGPYGEYEHGKHGYGNDKGWHAGYGNPLNGILKATGEINSCLIDFESLVSDKSTYMSDNETFHVWQAPYV